MNHEVIAKLCGACNKEFSDYPCEPSECALLEAMKNAVKVIRCKDCIFRKQPHYLTQKYDLPGTLKCSNRNSPCSNRLVLETDYCPYGERINNER